MTSLLTPFPNFEKPEFTTPGASRDCIPLPLHPISDEFLLPETARMPDLPPLPIPGSAFSTDVQTKPAFWNSNTQAFFAPPFANGAHHYTDDDLVAVLRPVVDQSLQHSFHQAGSSMETHWDPWLRTTIRRAFAQQIAHDKPASDPSFLNHLWWRLQSFFGDRYYEELVFEHTKRFRIEEVFLFEKTQRRLISFVSDDPYRQSMNKQVQRTVSHLIQSVFDNQNTIRLQFPMPRGRMAEVRQGKRCLLVAIILGNIHDTSRSDLDYTLRRIENRYGSRLSDADDDLSRGLHPHLEDCLLITTPSSAA